MATHWNPPRQESRLNRIVKGLDQYALFRARLFDRQMKQLKKLVEIGAFDGTAQKKLTEQIKEKM